VPKQGDLKKFCLVCFTFILAFSPVANEEEKEEEHEKNFKNRLSFALRVQRELADKEPYSITFISKSHDEKFAM
jgi:hypothetical protein